MTFLTRNLTVYWLFFRSKENKLIYSSHPLKVFNLAKVSDVAGLIMALTIKR